MDFKNKKVAVTGGAGLIGSHITERLVAAGAHVVVADDFSTGRVERLAAVRDRIEIGEGDLTDPSAMNRALEGADAVFHLASRVYGVGYSATHHLAMLDHNERITTNLISTLMQRPVAHLMVTSSSCVYSDEGPDTVPELSAFVGEPEMANWGYGWAKRFLEQKALMLARETGTGLTIVRPFNIYGERYTWRGQGSQAIPMLVKKILDGEDPVIIWGSGTQRRNYLHAYDCADAMVGLVENGFAGTVNIGIEESVALYDLVQSICRLAGKRPRLTTDTTKPEGRRIKSCDSTRLRKAYPGFRHSIDLDTGLTRMFGWYRTTFDETNNVTRGS